MPGRESQESKRTCPGRDFVNGSHQFHASLHPVLALLSLQNLMYRPANIGLDGRGQLLLHGNL